VRNVVRVGIPERYNIANEDDLKHACEKTANAFGAQRKEIGHGHNLGTIRIVSNEN
jgi:hypothetical protein